MRSIGNLNTAEHATRFRDYLYTSGIDNEIEQNTDDSWTIWVISEDQLKAGGELLSRFKNNPDDDEFAGRTGEAEALRQHELEQEHAAEKRMLGKEHLFPSAKGIRGAPFTLFLIIASVCVAIISKMGSDINAIHSLFIADPALVIIRTQDWWAGLAEVQDGQVWRLITPIIIHFGPIHLIFNMLWLRDLGSMIENRKGIVFFAAMVIAIAIPSNVAQFALHGPMFGGMSGVVYGLLGYVWMKGKFDPRAGMRLQRQTVTMMIAWFFICFFLPHIANTVHTVGLAIGILWGYLSSLGALSKRTG